MKQAALSMTFIAGMILVLLALIGLAFYMRATFQATEMLVHEKQCAISVKQEAALHQASKATGAGYTAGDFAGNVQCSTMNVTLEGDARALAGSTARQMQKCWQMLGNGRLEFFSRDDGAFCHICSVLTLPGTLFDVRTAVQRLQGNYDAPASIAGTKHAVIFRYQLKGAAASQTVFVRPLDPAQPQALDICAGAEFSRQR